MKYVTSKQDVPDAPHYAVLKFSSIFIPGDERSRTCPGHGYPESSQAVVEYIAFTTMQELETWVVEHEKDNYTILNVSRLAFKLEKKLVELTPIVSWR